MKLIKPSSRARLVFYPKTASNAQAEGDLAFLTSGAVSKCASAANAAVIAGVAIRPVTASDSDYAATAATTSVPYLVDEDGVWEMDVQTATSFGIGVTCDAHTDGQKLVCNAATYDTFVIVGGTTTKAHVQIRRWATSDAQAIA
jgi:hypothetical protein